jgi:hypothetical protein
MANMVVKLARFVTWPADLASPATGRFQMCVTGDDRLLGHLEELAAQERIGDLPIQARRLTKLREMQGCHVIFLGAGSDERFAAVTEPTLTVSAEPGFVDNGGIVELSIQQGKVSFQINAKEAERLRLQISSRVLALARNIGRRQ